MYFKLSITSITLFFSLFNLIYKSVECFFKRLIEIERLKEIELEERERRERRDKRERKERKNRGEEGGREKERTERQTDCDTHRQMPTTTIKQNCFK